MRVMTFSHPPRPHYETNISTTGSHLSVTPSLLQHLSKKEKIVDNTNIDIYKYIFICIERDTQIQVPCVALLQSQCSPFLLEGGVSVRLRPVQRGLVAVGPKHHPPATHFFSFYLSVHTGQKQSRRSMRMMSISSCRQVSIVTEQQH